MQQMQEIFARQTENIILPCDENVICNELAGGCAVTARTPERPRSVPEAFYWLPDGRLVLLFDDHFEGVNDESPARISYMISADQGVTWKEEGALFPMEEKQSNIGPCILKLQSGRVAVAYMHHDGDMDELNAYIRFGDDSLKTWSAPVPVTTDGGYNCSSGSRLIQLSGGRLIYATAYLPHFPYDNQPGAFVAYVWFSDDDGRTWQRNVDAISTPRRERTVDAPANQPDDRGAMEPCVVELKDGRLLMVIRTQLGFVYRSVSEDQGETWSEPAPMPLEAPDSCPYITRIPSTGDLMMVWNGSRYNTAETMFGYRCPLTFAISRDEGETWSRPIALEHDPKYTHAMPIVTFDSTWAIFSYYRCEGIQWCGHLQCVVNRCRIEAIYDWLA